MAASKKDTQRQVDRIAAEFSPEEIERRLAPKFHPAPPRVPGATRTDPAVIERRWAALARSVPGRAEVADERSIAANTDYARNIENFIGTVKVPVGLVGPLRVNGLAAQGDYYLPLATTEAALVASYDRGANVITEAGGASVLTLNEGVSRAPAFAFKTLLEAGRFVQWCIGHDTEIRQAAEATTRHGRLQDLRFNVEGNHVYLLCEFTTEDASGQNMVTIATQAICNLLAAACPIKPAYGFVEGNFSGDKKASTQSFHSVRGRKVVAEVRIPRSLVDRRLHTTPERMVEYWTMSAMGGILSGTIGVQGHYANGLAALFIACGQDAACVSEAAVGITRLEVDASNAGALYACVTLPNLIVGTVGGGTGMPSQKACLDIVGLAGAGKARAFAEVCAALVLAGELSISAALTAHQFAQAHARLARGRGAAKPGAKSR
ncbi:MAG: hydroxymethylglutaryl-CoA reductase [Opitutaceae bacterium]